MVDISAFCISENEPHTHRIIVDDEEYCVQIPHEKMQEILSGCVEEGYEIEELLGDICIPYVSFKGEYDKGSHFLQFVMRHMYNSHGPIAVLEYPDDEEANAILCAPMARVNKEMLKEIQESFMVICKHSGIDYEPGYMQYMPLTWRVTAYKDGAEVGADVVFPNESFITLSTYLVDIALSNRSKRSKGDAKQAALIESIVLYSRETIKGDTIKATELMSMISKDRSKDGNAFVSLGKCLHSIFKGDGQGLNLWRNATVSEMQDECDEAWADLETTSTTYTVRTLEYWAKMDSPTKFKQWNSTSVRTAMESAVMATGGTLDVATAAYRLDPILFICEGEDAKDARFYMFNGTYYKPCGIFHLQNYLEQRVLPEFEDFNKDMSTLLNSNPDNSFKEMIQKKIDRNIKIIKDLKEEAFHQRVIKTLMRLYNKAGFDRIKNAKKKITCFEDIVWDGELLKFRDGLPEDYITTSTGYPFKDSIQLYENEPNHEDILKVHAAFKQIIPQDNRRQFVFEEFASRLEHSNVLKRMLTIFGHTNNGKSQVGSYLAQAFGPVYCPTVPSNLLYSDDGSPGAASPQYEIIKDARILQQTEVTDKQVLNEGTAKRLTSTCDPITYRPLYGKSILSFLPACVPMTFCNSLAKMNGNAAALRSRLVMLELLSTFITEKDVEWTEELSKLPTQEERDRLMEEKHWYWADLSFDAVIAKTYKAFMWILIQTYIFKARHGEACQPSKIPECIVKDTVKTFIKSNIYHQFVNQAVKKSAGSPGVTTYQMYSAYKKWFADNISRFGAVEYGKFQDELAVLKIKPINDLYPGVTIVYQ